MKMAALLAFVLAALGMLLSCFQYVLFILERHDASSQKIIWPLSIIFHGLPMIILSLAILFKSDANR